MSFRGKHELRRPEKPESRGGLSAANESRSSGPLLCTTILCTAILCTGQGSGTPPATMRAANKAGSLSELLGARVLQDAGAHEHTWRVDLRSIKSAHLERWSVSGPPIVCQPGPQIVCDAPRAAPARGRRRRANICLSLKGSVRRDLLLGQREGGGRATGCSGLAPAKRAPATVRRSHEPALTGACSWCSGWPLLDCWAKEGQPGGKGGPARSELNGFVCRAANWAQSAGRV